MAAQNRQKDQQPNKKGDDWTISII
jgi:hypothetical protein